MKILIQPGVSLLISLLLLFECNVICTVHSRGLVNFTWVSLCPGMDCVPLGKESWSRLPTVDLRCESPTRSARTSETQIQSHSMFTGEDHYMLQFKGQK